MRTNIFNSAFKRIVLWPCLIWLLLTLLEVWSGPSDGLFALQVSDVLLAMGMGWCEYNEWW